MKSTCRRAAAALALLCAVHAQSNAPACSPDAQCPSEAPCCSQYGRCGVGAYCLGGCDPKSSHSLQSCMPSHLCQSQHYKLASLDDVAKNTAYLGDAAKANWVSSGTPVAYNADSLLLTMAPSTVGTLLSSTHYVWYGKVCATMTTSQGKGVVTAFILMSDVKDEIDFEFVGNDLSHAQSNYYYQGITDYHNMDSLDATDTRRNAHEYCIDWKPDSVVWSIDGKDMRTLNKPDTWNSTTHSYHFPQTPARVQLSLWPAGLSTNGEGTIEWAGGLVDWDSPYMQNGYYYAMVRDVSVECYDPPRDFAHNFGGQSYYYTRRAGTNDTVAIGNNNTILSSFLASGDNPTLGAPSSGSSSSAPSSAATAKTSHPPESVPGVSGGGNVASSGQAPTDSHGAAGSGTASAGNSPMTGPSSSGAGFSQGASSPDTSQAPKIMAASAVALVGFFVAALTL